MAITLAPAALERIRGFLAADPAALGLRFGVVRSGCSGWGYLAELASEERVGDIVFADTGVRIYVDADRLTLVAGARLASPKSGLHEEFTFTNPKVAAACGGGEGIPPTA